MSARTSINIHTDDDDKVEVGFTENFPTCWLSIEVGGSDVTFFVTKDQAIAIGKSIMDSADAWAKV